MNHDSLLSPTIQPCNQMKPFLEKKTFTKSIFFMLCNKFQINESFSSACDMMVDQWF